MIFEPRFEDKPLAFSSIINANLLLPAFLTFYGGRSQATDTITFILFLIPLQDIIEYDWCRNPINVPKDRSNIIKTAYQDSYPVLIFMTGAATLALEVLASRMMTPYFGVSLYIWAGILSITLVFLAVGYQCGGKASSRLSRTQVEGLFLAAPVASALAIFMAVLLYPVLFPWLSQGHLVIGSFIGASLLLALPLIALSAMNPLLICLLRRPTQSGDSGAGRVFFISTMGSVAGVLVTAFVFIPNMTNFRGALVLAVGLCLVSLVFGLPYMRREKTRGRLLLLSSLAVGLAAAVLMLAKDSYLQAVGSRGDGYDAYRIVDEYTSVFGNIKVVDVDPAEGRGETQRMFVQDGLVQNRTRLDHSSLSAYTGALETLVGLHAPDARDVLVLGLGAGIVPRNLAARGKQVTVVEINPSALVAATDHFGFPARRIDVRIEDARTFVRRCRAGFDAVVVDLFLGDNVPDYLMTREFFDDLKRCLRADGTVAMNVFFDAKNPLPNGRLLATVGANFATLYLSGSPSGNVYIAATTKPPATDNGPQGGKMTSLSSFSLPHNLPLGRRHYANLEPISDTHNIFSLLFSDANIATRQYLAGELPAHVLVN